jgi:MFS transporter, YNFM family, putative membrane transport protein
LLPDVQRFNAFILLDEGAAEQRVAAMPDTVKKLIDLRVGAVGVFVCGLVAFLTLYATQPLLPLLESLFHASKSAVGWTVSASTLGVAIAAPLRGVFTDHMNRSV